MFTLSRAATRCAANASFPGALCGLRQCFAQASEFFAGYLLEQSLSVDNLFVFVLLFGYFKVRRDAFSPCHTQQCSERNASFPSQVPKAYEAKVLEYGILGAAGLRAVFICAWDDLSRHRVS